jgi:diguanylate cyclase (GGDEF)-like protein
MRILLVEDSPLYRRLIESCLRQWGFEFSVATRGTDAWKMLQQADSPRLVLLDWMLPGMDGVEICKNIRRRSPIEPYVYTILLTARSDKTDLICAMEAGADDFLTKPFDEAELRARLFAGKRILELQEQLVSARESLRFAATHDSLTGIWNRAEVLDFLKREMCRSERDQRPLGVILADVDHFKNINDTFGHSAGDHVLMETARRLGSGLRPYDGVGRYGGEEFLLVMPGCDLDTTIRRGEEIRANVSTVPVDGSRETTVTISMGATSGIFRRDLDVGQLLQVLDVALYKAKHNGRNQLKHDILPAAAGAPRGSGETAVAV